MSIGIRRGQRHQLTGCWLHVAPFARLLGAAKQSRPALLRHFLHPFTMQSDVPCYPCKFYMGSLAQTVWIWSESRGVFFFSFFLSVYLKFQSNRSRATLFVAAVFSFSSHPSFNFKLSSALCLQAICVLWTKKKLCQKEAFLSSPPVTEQLLDNCN